MSKTCTGMVVGSLVAWALLGQGAASGQDFDFANRRYSEGVRAYFSGRSQQAEVALSDALAANSQDPRIYYFRALSLLRQGRAAEARGDMLAGAALEAQRPNRFAVGTALERVQGGDRLLLEQFRRQARLDAASMGPALGQTTTVRRAEPLRERVVISLDEYLQPGGPRPALPSTIGPAPPRTFAIPAVPDDPFRDDPQPPGG